MCDTLSRSRFWHQRRRTPGNNYGDRGPNWRGVGVDLRVWLLVGDAGIASARPDQQDLTGTRTPENKLLGYGLFDLPDRAVCANRREGEPVAGVIGIGL